MTTDFACPDCGAPLYIDPAVIVSEEYAPGYNPTRGVPRRERPTAVAACTACEFIIEISPAPTH